MNSKKSQAEIMGLALVIMLIVVGIVFVFKFMDTGSEDSLRQDFVDSKLASNMINVILKTTLDCKNIEIKNLYQDCARGVSHLDYCGEPNPCVKAELVVQEILNKTLDKWKRNYRFTATINGVVKTEIANNDCHPENIGTKYRKLESETYPIPTDEGTMMIRLDICR